MFLLLQLFLHFHAAEEHDFCTGAHILIPLSQQLSCTLL